MVVVVMVAAAVAVSLAVLLVCWQSAAVLGVGN